MGSAYSVVAPSSRALVSSIRQCDTEEVTARTSRLLLRRAKGGPSPKATLGTAVRLCAKKGDHSMLCRILGLVEEHSADLLEDVVNYANGRRQTPLLLASKFGHLQVVQTLLKKGANVWAADTNGGRCPIHHAAYYNHSEVIAALLDGAAQQPRPGSVGGHMGTRYVNARTQYGLTPLLYAAKGQALQAGIVLLQRGAAVNAASLHDGELSSCPRGSTPLHLAAREGHRDMVLLLLQQHMEHFSSHGCDPRQLTDAEGLLPFHYALTNNHGQLAELLCPSRPLAALVNKVEAQLPLGPPSLARLATAALHTKLGHALHMCHPQDQQSGPVVDLNGGSTGCNDEPNECLMALGGGESRSCHKSCGAASCGGAAAVRAAPFHSQDKPSWAAEVDEDCCCPVCLEATGSTAVVLQPCNHQVCYTCCQSLWRMKSHELLLCPLCRGPVGNFAMPGLGEAAA